ncbi:MAG: hypothetical protein ABSB49_08125 [Polyangia bacterium]|jgi:hypothetical protein
MLCCYAIIPDGESLPAALFIEIEDAMDWGLRTYGRQSFRIRYLEVAQIEKGDRAAAAFPA